MTLQDAIALGLEGLRGLEHGEEAEKAFYALGAFAPKPAQFSWEAAKAITGVEVKILALLVVRNMVETNGEFLALHQVLATFAAIKLDKEYVSRHRDYYLNLAKEGPNAQSQIDKEMRQIVRIVQLTVVELIPMMMRSATVLPRIP